MRRCCCCLSVHVGSFLLGLVCSVLSGLELALLIPYALELEGFNPIQDNANQFYFVVDKMVEEHNGSGEEALEFVQRWLRPVLLAESAFAAIYLLFSLLLMVGIQCRQRSLLLPYLVLQLGVIVIFLAVGIAVTVMLFFLSGVMGVVCLGVVILATGLFAYLWMAVQKAYVEIGNRDYMYSPAPLKPIYNPHDQSFQPSAPQQFSME